MPAKSPLPPTTPAPLRARVVVGWVAFFSFVLTGIVLWLRAGASVAVLVDGIVR